LAIQEGVVDLIKCSLSSNFITMHNLVTVNTVCAYVGVTKNLGEAGAPPQLLGAWLSPGNTPIALPMWASDPVVDPEN